MSKSGTDIPFTPSQQALLVGQMLAPQSTLYNMIMTFEIEADIDEQAFSAAFQDLVNDVDAMRITIQYFDGYTAQNARQIIQTNIDYTLELIDFSSSSDPDKHLETWLSTRTQKILDLSVCLFDTALIKLDTNKYIWYFNQHHLATDGWSLKLVFDYLSLAYLRHSSAEQQAKSSDLLEHKRFPYTFADYAHSVDEQGKDTSERALKNRKRSEAYWQQRLDKPFTPNTFYRQASNKNHDSSMFSASSYKSTRSLCAFGKDRSHEFRALSISEEFAAFSPDLGQMQLFATILIACLYRLNGGERQALGTPYHGRVKRNHKSTPGVFINVFPLHIDIAEGETFVSLYEKLARSNQGLLLNSLPGTSKVAKENSFDVLFNFINAKFGEFAGNQTYADFVHAGESDHAHKLRVLVHDFDNTGAFKLLFDTNDSYFSQTDVKELQRHFLILSDALIADPHQAIAKPALIPSLDAQSIANDKHVKKHGHTVLQYIQQATHESKLRKQRYSQEHEHIQSRDAIALCQYEGSQHEGSQHGDGQYEDEQQAYTITYAELEKITDDIASNLLMRFEHLVGQEPLAGIEPSAGKEPSAG